MHITASVFINDDEPGLLGREVVVAITDGELDLGPWDRSSTASSTVAGASACW